MAPRDHNVMKHLKLALEHLEKKGLALAFISLHSSQGCNWMQLQLCLLGDWMHTCSNCLLLPSWPQECLLKSCIHTQQPAFKNCACWAYEDMVPRCSQWHEKACQTVAFVTWHSFSLISMQWHRVSQSACAIICWWYTPTWVKLCHHKGR